MKTFTYNGHTIRVVGGPDFPALVASDVGKALGLANVARTIRDFPALDKVRVTCPGEAGEVEALSPSGVVRLDETVPRRLRPAARAFTRWVFGDVLPVARRSEATLAAEAAVAALEKALSSALAFNRQTLETNKAALGALSQALAATA